MNQKSISVNVEFIPDDEKHIPVYFLLIYLSEKYMLRTTNLNLNRGFVSATLIFFFTV